MSRHDPPTTMDPRAWALWHVRTDVERGYRERTEQMTFNPSDYHPDWKDIRRQILDQADHRCEFCGAPNGEVGDHDAEGRWWTLDAITHQFGVEGLTDPVDSGYWPTFPKGSLPVKVVLTTAHLCHDKQCIDPCCLRALCQACHLNWDRPHHLAKQAENRRRRIVAAGQQPLLEVMP